MAGGTDDDLALSATIAPVVDAVGATVASDAGTQARGRPVSLAPDDASALGPVDPTAYVRGKVLASGGMGRIVAAQDRRLGRQVALKEVLGGTPELRRRFAREAKLTARLQHPNIITVHEAGVWPDGEPFFAMKLVAGRALDKVIAEKTTLDARLALLPSLIAVADALAYAHRERVIHRDLKPANVLVGDFGETVVIDWGLAKDLAATESGAEAPGPAAPYRTVATGGPHGENETAFGAVIGTPAYMPPEQARGDAVDERADVYALGALIYHVLCGRPPVDGNSLEEVLTSVLSTAPLPARTREGRIPRELDTIVAKAMAREPADRYPTAVELAADLRRFQTGQLVGAHHYTPWQLVRRWIARRRTPLAVAAIALVVLAVGGAVSVWRVLGERDVAERNAALATANGERAAAALRALLIDSGRREWLAGHPLRALALLVEALPATGAPSSDLAFLLARTAPAADAVLFRGGAGATDVRFTADQRALLVATSSGRLRVLDPHTGAVVEERDLHAGGRVLRLGTSAALAALEDHRPDEQAAVTTLAGPAATGEPVTERTTRVEFDEAGTRAWLLGPFARTVQGTRHASLAASWRWQGIVAARAAGADLLLVTDTEIVHLRDDGAALGIVSRAPHHVGDPTGAAISRDLARVAIVASDRVAFVGSEGQTVATVQSRYRDAIAMERDGRRVAVLADADRVELYDWTDDSVRTAGIVELSAPGAQIDVLDFGSSEHALLAWGRDPTVFVIDPGEGLVVARLTAELALRAAALSRDGNLVAAALGDGTVVTWSVQRALTPPTLGATAHCAGFAAEGDLVTYSDRGLGRLGLGPAGNIDDGHVLRTCAFAADGHALLLTSIDGFQIVDLHDPRNHRRTIDVPDGVSAAAITPDGRRVAVRVRGGALDVHDASGTTTRWPTPPRGPDSPGFADDLAWDDSGTYLLDVDFAARRVRAVDAASGAMTEVQAPGLVSARWAAGSARIAIAAGAQAIVWDVRTDARVTIPQPSAATDAVLSPRDGSLFTAGEDGVVRQWSAAGAAVRALRVTRGRVEHVAVEPAGERIATTSSLREAALWSTATGDQLAALGEVDRPLRGLAFRRDGNRIYVLPEVGGVQQFDTGATLGLDAAALRALVTRAVPWAVEGGRVVPRALAP